MRVGVQLTQIVLGLREVKSLAQSYMNGGAEIRPALELPGFLRSLPSWVAVGPVNFSRECVRILN